VQIEAHPQAALVDVEEVAKPRTEERDHPRVAVREVDAPIRPGTFPRVQGDPGDQELPLRQPADAGPALLDQAIDLGLAPSLEDVGLSAAAPRHPGNRLELHVADPHRDAALGHAEAGGDLGQGQPGAPQLPCLLAFGELAPVAHGRILP
jgi:hypothetical protein